MRTALQQRLTLLDNQLDALFEDLSKYSSEQLNRQPAPDSWSALQVLHHLLLSEKYSRQYCEKKLSFNPTLPKVGLASSARSKLVSVYLSSPFKFKAPKAISAAAFPAQDELPNVASLYRKQREKLAEFVAGVDEKYLDKQVYKHPFGGRLSIDGMFAFFDAHFKHHSKQIYRALA